MRYRQEVEWVKLEDRKPDKSGIYLAHGGYNSDPERHRFTLTLFYRAPGKGISGLQKDTWHGDERHGKGIAGTVTHWMPLPKPPPCE